MISNFIVDMGFRPCNFDKTKAPNKYNVMSVVLLDWIGITYL